jgi:hypothetical protein
MRRIKSNSKRPAPKKILQRLLRSFWMESGRGSTVTIQVGLVDLFQTKNLVILDLILIFKNYIIAVFKINYVKTLKFGSLFL